MGPLISPQAKERVNSLIQSGVDEGAKLLLDGRNVKVKGYENGNFVGPTIISNVTVITTICACSSHLFMLLHTVCLSSLEHKRYCAECLGVFFLIHTMKVNGV